MFIGFAGTVAMTVYSYVAHTVSLPQVDYRSMISNVFPAGEMGTWGIYFAIGIFFAFMYNLFFKDRLPAHSWMRGMFYGFMLWCFMGFVFMPVMGMGFFAGSVSTALGMLLGVVCYGMTVGYMYEAR